MWFERYYWASAMISLAVGGIYQIMIIKNFADRNRVGYFKSFHFLNLLFEGVFYNKTYKDENFFDTEIAKTEKVKYLKFSFFIVFPILLVWVFLLLPIILVVLEKMNAR